MTTLLQGLEWWYTGKMQWVSTRRVPPWPDDPEVEHNIFSVVKPIDEIFIAAAAGNRFPYEEEVGDRGENQGGRAMDRATRNRATEYRARKQRDVG